MTEHPLELTRDERDYRLTVIAARLAEIEAILAANARQRADGGTGDGVDPVLESEWGRLDTERRQIAALMAGSA